MLGFLVSPSRWLKLLKLTVYLTWWDVSVAPWLYLIGKYDPDNNAIEKRSLTEPVSTSIEELTRSWLLSSSESQVVEDLQLNWGFLKELPRGTSNRVSLHKACVSASPAHWDMWYAELWCTIKDRQANKVWEPYGRGGVQSYVRNARTYGKNDVCGILPLIFLSKVYTHMLIPTKD